MNKKNIDNLFQEKFRDFSEVPSEGVWESIEASLDKKKKSRRIIPFWWQLGGVAALMALMLYVVNPFGNEPNTNGTIITDTENSNKKNSIEKDSVTKKDFQVPNDEKESLTESQKDNQSKEERNNALDEQPFQQKDSYATSESNDDEKVSEENKGNLNEKRKSVYKNFLNTKESVTNIDSKNHTTEKGVNKNKKEKGQFQNDIETKKNAVAINADATNNKGFNENVDSNNKKALSNSTPNKEKAVVQEDILKQKEEQKKKSIFDEMEKQKNEKEALVENNAKNRWSAGPSVAPVYFDASGEGSPVHSIFVPNEKSGNVNLSYGLTVSYEINKRLSVRSGVHKVDYGYDTDDVSFSSSLNGSTNEQIDNISYNATSKNLVLRGKASAGSSNNEIARLDTNAKSPEREGIMSQQFGYIEVPLELNYALVDKKVGVNVVGGFSSLFLVNNTISVEGDGQVMELGEANNLNNLNFSANAGIGVDYNFTPKVKLSLEPVFKYQLNTFSQTDGTFQPFSVGVYSGLTFRF